MRKIIIGVGVVMALFTIHNAQAQDCKVNLESISGTYEGACKKGLANGFGEAKGKDTYKGEFKKGLPHGKGVYTWENLDMYEGEFVKGKMEGQGVFTAKSDQEVITGYWKDGEYIGKEKDPFNLLNRGSSIMSVKGVRLSGDKDQVDIVFLKKGKRISTQEITLRKVEGNFANIIQNGFKKEIQQINYPFRVMVSGPGSFEFKISQPGHWEVNVELMAN